MVEEKQIKGQYEIFHKKRINDRVVSSASVVEAKSKSAAFEFFNNVIVPYINKRAMETLFYPARSLRKDVVILRTFCKQ